jgi:hypothetical protein
MWLGLDTTINTLWFVKDLKVDEQSIPQSTTLSSDTSDDTRMEPNLLVFITIAGFCGVIFLIIVCITLGTYCPWRRADKAAHSAGSGRPTEALSWSNSLYGYGQRVRTPSSSSNVSDATDATLPEYAEMVADEGQLMEQQVEQSRLNASWHVEALDGLEDAWRS